MIVELLIWIIVFMVIAYVAYWLCQKFNAPQPVIWLVGLVLLVILLVRISGMMGVRLP